MKKSVTISNYIYPFNMFVYRKHKLLSETVGNMIINIIFFFIVSFSFGGVTIQKAYEIGAPAAKSYKKVC